MNRAIKEQIICVLEDDNEVMTAALEPGSDLDEENKRMNRGLIESHKRIIEKIEKNEQPTQYDLQLIRDANEIHLNDAIDVAGHHQEAVMLDDWLSKQMEVE